MKIHRLKTWPEHYGDVYSEKKKQDIRIDDRGFKKEDILILQEYDPETAKYSGAAMIRVVTHVLREHEGLKPGYVIMSIRHPGQISGACALCKCTDTNCRQCIEKTGQPCHWVNPEHTLCSACAFEGEEVSHA
tara:strand:+ start:3865 stop:4263 length:399 start_codon:yes stop_codon:yes gene_type:complete